MIDDICVEIKKEEYNNVEKSFGERQQGDLLVPQNSYTCASRKKYLKQLDVLCQNSGIQLTLDEEACVFLPNSDLSLQCYAWMKAHFSLIGDEEPNSHEIHLEPCYIKDIYEEYKLDQEVNGSEHLKSTQFGLMWQKCFPYVNSHVYSQYYNSSKMMKMHR